MQAELADALSKTTPQHLGLIYSDQREQLAAAVPYIRTGLERGEQCVYVANDNSPDCVLDAMRDGGIDVDRAIRSDALRMITDRDAYLKEGDFDPRRMVAYVSDAARAARRAGFTALRATGEMTWALGDAPGADRLMEYEAHLDRALPTLPAAALCQYNRARFPEETVRGAIQTHPWLIVDGTLCDNPFYVPSDTIPGAPSAAIPSVEDMLRTIVEGQRRAPSALSADRRLDVSPGAVIAANLYELITPFIDGELPETTAAEVARQLSANAELRRLVEAERTTKRTVARLAGLYAAPSELKRRIRLLISAPGKPGAGDTRLT